MTQPKQLSAEAFNALTAEFIHIANAQAKAVDSFSISEGAFLHAAACYSAFITAVGEPTGADMLAKKEDMVARISARFREYLDIHYIEYAKNFDTYMAKVPSEKDKG
ncbi:DUF3144 domain-containing protein [Asticcacaulis sp.]|uniref:DUF3144 domain-containing protein n=1 Tax=Asticcacaulis sp. TaxID=1872648 RepID=UPI00260F09B5|nr:DUF3144 domain-containing protein [Asticcacaulis sp.]